jgi:hypothetical protein
MQSASCGKIPAEGQNYVYEIFEEEKIIYFYSVTVT